MMLRHLDYARWMMRRYSVFPMLFVMLSLVACGGSILAPTNTPAPQAPAVQIAPTAAIAPTIAATIPPPTAIPPTATPATATAPAVIPPTAIPTRVPATQAPPSTAAPAAQGNGPVAGNGLTCPTGFPVKANTNSGIYHLPGQRFYNATNARNCYRTEEAAQAAGYRASKV